MYRPTSIVKSGVKEGLMHTREDSFWLVLPDVRRYERCTIQSCRIVNSIICCLGLINTLCFGDDLSKQNDLKNGCIAL